MLVIRQHFSTR